MESAQKTAIFMYANKSFAISCNGKEKLNHMIQKFIKEFNPDSKIIDYIFYYEGKKIETNTYDKNIEDNELFGKKQSFIISVEKNIKVIECPKCNYGDCVVSLLNYKTTFYNCEHKHLVISSYDNYFTDQLFYPEKILCSGNNCNINEKMDPDFSLCLTCSKLLNRTKSICNTCIKKHKNEFKDENENEHVIIKYEDKNYYCKDHIQRMKKYCFQCKKNLCDGCVAEHLENKEKYKEHQIKSIESLIPDKKELEDLDLSLKEIKKSMDSLKIIIDDLIYTLNGAMRIYQNYYKIANHIIGKYEKFNKGEKDFKNFTIFKCLRNLKFSNAQILQDLQSIINEKDKFDKAKKLIGIYADKKKNYHANDGKGNDLNKEDDTEWNKEVIEREKIKEKQKQNNPLASSSNANKKRNESKRHNIHNKK